MLKEILESLKPWEDNSGVHNEFKNFSEIEKAVKAGKPVFWANGNYEVQDWGPRQGLHVMSLSNASVVGLGNTKYDIERCYLDAEAARKATHNKNSKRYKG